LRHQRVAAHQLEQDRHLVDELKRATGLPIAELASSRRSGCLREAAMANASPHLPPPGTFQGTWNASSYQALH
jgi:hypothetical protein